jgi:glutaredoxin-like protein
VVRRALARSDSQATGTAKEVTMPEGRPIEKGASVPSATLRLLRDGKWQEQRTDELFSNRRVILFGLPGAFTPTCSAQHLPRFDEVAPALLARGIDEIVCASVNDPYVMDAWAREQGAQNITFLADGNGDFTAALGLLVDRREHGFGQRSVRYSMLVADGRVEELFVEPDTGDDPYTVSDADTMLRAIDPDAEPPDQVVIFSREGCPDCARARELLEEAGFSYVEIPLDADIRHRVTEALARRSTVPLVYLNGQLIGGAEELEAMVHGPSGPPESRPT